MRQHDPYTNFVVHKLEKQGLEIVRDPVIDWLDYVNKMNIRNNKRDIGLALKSFNLSRALRVTKKYAQSYLKGKYMSSVEDKIAGPFHEVLKGRHVLPKPIDMIETLERNQEGHGNIEGESPLSTGIAYHLMNDLVSPVGDACISGIYHVGPFTCMQEGVATAKIEAMAKELRKKKPDLVFPIIHAYFGDSASANLESEIAVFTEQCYQKREVLMEKYGMKAPSPRTPERMDIKAVSAARRTAESLTRAEEP
jgi:predicted nucleotide-binding protein (sugar kinase/HSP70/actin superfamily)